MGNTPKASNLSLLCPNIRILSTGLEYRETHTGFEVCEFLIQYLRVGYTNA